MGVTRASWAIPVIVGLLPALAAAQELTVVVVPEDAPAAVRDALRSELQLSGRRVALRTAAVVDTARVAPHGEGTEMILLGREAGEYVLVRVSPAGARRAERLGRDTLSPRVVASIAAVLMEIPWDPPAGSRLPALPAASHALDAPAFGAPRASLPRRREAPAEAEASSVPPREERVLWELLGATLGGLSIGLFGTFLGLEASPDDPSDGFPYWTFGLTVGTALGVPAAVAIAGRATGAEGDPFWTVAAGLFAGAVTTGLLLLGRLFDSGSSGGVDRTMDGNDTAFTILGVVLAVALPPALSILAFELTVPDPVEASVSVGPGSLQLDVRF